MEVTTFSTPAGMSVSRAAIAPTTAAHQGVSGAGLSTTVHPAASAGPIFAKLIWWGKFHGVIAPTTPTGLRVQDGKLFLDMSDGTTLEVTLPAGGTTPPAQVAPSFTSQPMLTGSTALGSTITVSLGAASGTPTPTITGSLARPGRAAAAVAHGSTFAIEAGDVAGLLQGRPVAPALRRTAAPRRLTTPSGSLGGPRGGVHGDQP